MRLSRKPLLFKSFTGLTVQQFDDLYDKEIAKRYDKYEIQQYLKETKIEKGTWAPEEGLSNLT